MKRIIALFLLCILLAVAAPFSSAAATELKILHQPQNPVYNVGAVVGFAVTVAGENPQCTWYMNFEGKKYNISNLDDGVQDPWEAYCTIGCNYVAIENTHSYDVPHTTFYYYFNGAEAGLSGASVYAVITDGKNTVTSDVGWFQLLEGAKTPPEITVAPSATVTKGGSLEISCSAKAIYGGELTYVWYETHNGDLSYANPMEGGHRQGQTLTCDTDVCGTRYYVCFVREEGGGHGYSSVIPVTVTEETVSTLPDGTESGNTGVTSDVTDGTTVPTSDSSVGTDPADGSQSGTASDSENGANTWLYVSIGLGVAVIGLGTAIVILLTKKKV